MWMRMREMSTSDSNKMPVTNEKCDKLTQEIFSQIRAKIPIWLYVPTIGLVLFLMWIIWDKTSGNESRIQDMRVEVGQMSTLMSSEFKHQGEKLEDIKLKIEKMANRGGG
jgi:hypothetical protein